MSSSSPPPAPLKTSHRPSPPPPLDRLALTTPTTTVHKSTKATSEPAAVPHRGVAMAVLNRLLHEQSAKRSPAPAEEKDAPVPPVAPTDLTRQPVRAPNDTAASSGKNMNSDHSETCHLCEPPSPQTEEVVASNKDEAEQEEEQWADDVVSTDEEAEDGALPWWQRILIDKAYRRRLMQLSTEGYRAELRILRETPDVISGSAGREQRKVLRERQWWVDELAGSTSTTQNLTSSYAASPDVPATSSSREGDSSAPILDEVEETVVMAQHVVFRVPPHSSLSSTFATQHPRAIINASALETIRTVALGVMPPVQHTRELARQEAAVDAHLSAQRRFSRENSFTVKAQLAKDIVAGRHDVPMQTAITSAVLEAETQLESAEAVSLDGTARMPQETRHNTDRHHKTSTVGTSTAVAESVFPQRPPPRADTPLRIRRGLPSRRQDIVDARHAEMVAEINVRSSALLPSPVPLLTTAINASSTAADGELEEAEQQASEVTVVGGENGKREMYAEQHQLRCREAARACTDGTENLYGLQYVWRLPLPPSGFIRVSPDPRRAMWPDDTVQLKGSFTDNAGTTGYGGHLHRSAYSSGNTVGAANGGGSGSGGEDGTRAILRSAANRHRQHQMHRLARRVNKRTRKLQWLHEIGRRRACYNDLPLETESDESTTSLPSSVMAAADNDTDDHHALAALDWNPASPSRFNLNVVRRMELRKRGVKAEDEAAVRRRRAARAVSAARAAVARLDAAAPVYDGPLHINVYAEMPVRRSRGRMGDSAASQRHTGTAGTFHSTLDTATATTRVFVGCFRQSRLLIHFKMYCRALHEEAEVRCGPPLTHLTTATATRTACGVSAAPLPGNTVGSSSLDPRSATLLKHVPRIPFPVLRVQTQPPVLRQPRSRQSPLPATISEAGCWEGLFPTPKLADLTTAELHAWRAVRESALVQQALRDIFEDLPHDKEGLLDKRTFVLFVLQLLQLFFPTHLSPTTHVAIAEEEWVYRGTTEHVGPRTFHEKFFGFPFIFLRDVTAVTETALVEFWSILRVCFRAQQEQIRSRVTGAPPAQPEDILLSSHLLVPLTSLNPRQLRALLSHPPAAFDPAIYDRFCLLTEAFHSDPVVHAAPRASQYTVARARVEQQLRALREAAAAKTNKQNKMNAAGSSSDTGNGDAALAAAALATSRSRTTKASFAATTSVLLSLSDQLSGSAGAASRIGIENAVQREREEQQRAAEAEEKQELLEHSTFYQRRLQLLHVRAATAVSGIQSTSSAWELHRNDVFEVPSGVARHNNSNSNTMATVAAAGGGGGGSGDVEDALLDYLDGVPPDVFSGRVSLRERYLLHATNQQRRQAHELPWLTARTTSGRTIASAASSALNVSGSGTASFNNTISGADYDRAEEKTRRFLSVMHGEPNSVRERQCAVAAENARLLGASGVAAAEHSGSGSGGDSQTAMTASYATGMYPLRPVPRTVSSILAPCDPRRRAQFLRRDDGDGGIDHTDAPPSCTFPEAKEKKKSGGEEVGSLTPARKTVEGVRRDGGSSRLQQQLQHQQRPPTSTAAPTPSSSFYATRGQHLRHRSFKNPFAGSRKSSMRRKSTTAPRAGPTPASGGDGETAKAMRSAPSRSNLTKSFHRPAAAATVRELQPQQLVPLSQAQAPHLLVSADTVVSVVASPEPSRLASPIALAGKPTVVSSRPISTVAFLEADTNKRSHAPNNDGEGEADDAASSVADGSVLLGSARSLFSGVGGHHATHASTARTALGGLESPSRDSHYAARLRARQQRQQRYQRDFGGSGKTAVKTGKR